ncbi:MAG: M48 family metalloprotease [Acidobacteriia bacterium]|nr:M48 family metalloprotease [Terriglobia bacterium]
MKPLARPGVILGAAIALCLLSVPLAAWQPTTNSADDDDDSGPPTVRVWVSPRLRGDVDFSIRIYATGTHQPVDLAAVLRSSMDCDWRAGDTGEDYVKGTCRHLLHANRGAVEDRLALAPLAKALWKAGITEVTFALSSKGDPVESQGLNWVKGGSGRKATRSQVWHFQATADSMPPPPFQVRVGSQWNPGRLGAPLLFVLCGPALLALWIRRQMVRKNAMPGAGVVWLNWILLGSWLYWISAVRIEDLGGFAAGLNLDSSLATVLIGSLFFALPPLLATAVCLLALLPQAQPGVECPSGQIPRMLRRTLAAEATFVVPLGLFLVGTTMMDDDWRTGMLGMAAAYGAYRLLAWCGWRWNSQRMLSLDGGDLRERAVAIAQAAGVELKSVCVLENRFPMEANAFAMGGGRISFTRGLLENMSRREVDSVIAHEVGHLRGKHIGMRTGLFVAYLVVIGPAVASFMTKAGLPAWAMALPIAPMLYVLAAGQLSQSNELNADARAVQLTNDPEGTIAALARLARLTRSPVDWGGMQGSILSHPSMQRRVLAVARRFGVPEPRALDLLRDPDLLASGLAEPAASARYALPQHIERADPVFTSTVKLSHAYWTPWVFGGTLIAFLLVAASIAAQPFNGAFGPLWSVLIFFPSLPLVGWLTMKMDDWWDCLFIGRIQRKIEAHSPGVAGTFVALIPGDRVLPLESQFAWDLGWLSLDADRLTYRGERAQFSVPRSDLTSIEIRKGPLGWCRTYAVVLRSSHATFSLRLAGRGRTRRLARRIEKQLNWWWRAEAPALAVVETEPLPAPDLPNVQPAIPSRLRIAWVFGVRTVLLFLATIVLLSVSPLMNRSPMFAFVPFTAPLVYLVVMCPTVVRPQ